MAVLHEMCELSNDVALNSPVTGESTVRKVLPGTFTHTVITTDCDGVASGSGAAFGPGGSGPGFMVKKLAVSEGGSRYNPNQTVMVFMGEAG